MTEEQKQAMAEGRRAAAEARAKEHIPQPVADLPAGHLRDEQLRVNADHLAERKETEHAEVGQERIDEEKFRHIDNEIAHHLTITNHADIRIDNPRPGYRYCLFTMEEGYGMNARSSIRAMRESAKADGFERVEGDTDEGANLDRCTDSGRRVGDTDLWRIKIQYAEALDRRHQKRLERQGLVEADYVHLGQTRLGHRNTAQANPATGPRFRDDMKPVTYQSNFNEADLRRGSIKDSQGRPLQPGYER